VEQAAALLIQTRSQLFPQVGYSASAARQRGSEVDLAPIAQRLITNPQNSYQVLASASWEIDLWGRIRRQTEAARANVLATEQARRGLILSLVGQVASAYLQLRSLDAQLEIANKTLAAYGQTLKVFELRFKYGQLSQMNVEQARSRYETAATQIPQIVTGIAQTENALSILLGRNPGPIDRGKSIQTLAVPAVPAGIPSELLARRPDIAQAEQSLIAANAQIGAAKALYFPNISLTGALGTSSSDLSNLFTGPSRLWSYGGSIVGPIFQGGAIRAQVAQTEASRKAALSSRGKGAAGSARAETPLRKRSIAAAALRARIVLSSPIQRGASGIQETMPSRAWATMAESQGLMSPARTPSSISPFSWASTPPASASIVARCDSSR